MFPTCLILMRGVTVFQDSLKFSHKSNFRQFQLAFRKVDLLAVSRIDGENRHTRRKIPDLKKQKRTINHGNNKSGKMIAHSTA